MRSIAVAAFKYGLAVSLVAWLIGSGKLDLGNIYVAFTHPVAVATGFAFLMLAHFATVARWHFLLKMQEWRLPFLDTFRYSMIGLFFSSFGFGVLSGDLVKAVYVSGKVRNKGAALVTVSLDRVVGLTALMIVAYAGLLFYWNKVSASPQLAVIARTIAVFLMAVAGLFLLGLSRKVKGHSAIIAILDRLPFSKFINEMYDAFHEMRKHPRFSGVIVLLSLIVPICNVLVFYFFAQAFNETQVTFTDYCLIVPLLFVVMSLPISPMGIGVGQVAALAIFNLVKGTSTTVGADLVTMLQLFTVLVALVGGYFFLRHRSEITELDSGAQTVQ